MALGAVTYSGIGYHGDVDLDKPVYKFYSLQRFLESVDKNRMYFRNVLNWADNWEMPTKLFNTNGLDEHSAFFFESDKWHSTFATCFTSEFDTDALWRIYSPGKSGICIETTARHLLQEMEPHIKTGVAFYYAPVIYEDVGKSFPEVIFDKEKAKEYPAQFYASFIKRRAFLHEQEMRLAVQKNDVYFRGANAPMGIELPVDMNKVIKRVILDPRLTPQEVSYHKTCLEELGFPTVQSSLFADVEFMGLDYAQSIKKVAHGTVTGNKFKVFKT